MFGAALLLLASAGAQAIDLTDRVSLGGVLAGAIQCQSLSDSGGADDTCEGALPIQPEIRFRPTANDELFVKLGFTTGNGLNPVTPFQISSWSADMAEDLTDINGSGRDYLLTAWYRHRFRLAPDNVLGITLGIIDATEYIDENAYANDPYTQFMNAALTNGPNVFVPSYDLGVAMTWDIANGFLHAVVMDVSQNIVGNEYTFYGIEAGYRLETPLGEGNYRILLDGTSNDFLDAQGASKARHHFVILSLDQELGDTLGVFMRLGRQDDTPRINYRTIYSGGLDFRGAAWGRDADNVGLGFAWLEGGNQAIRRTQIAEGYYRYVHNDFLSLTADVQYLHDSLKQGGGARGFLYGIRVTVEF